MTDIIDRIDALIDEQLAGGEPENGWDYGDPDFPECPRCGQDWHGLPITRTQWGLYDEDGNHQTTVLCEGSDFIGPSRPRVGNVQWTITIGSNSAEVMRRWRAQAEELAAAFAHLPAPDYDLRSWCTGTLYVLPNEFVSIGNYEIDRGPDCTQFLYDEFRQERPCDQAPEIDWTPGPHNWGPNVRHDEPLQFPQQWGWVEAPDPLRPLINAHWDEFTAPEHPLPEQPDYDFTRYDLDPVHGVFSEPRRRDRR
ncbi:hypothetical protein OS122_02620 [Mycolicibacterium mucogenicum]|uniref:hypothetical protein n=1 Tax=Mycolicibacterium mucogenicum TaxID=56689 RepID=UPI00226A2FDB|nr:hypothetical protein [Mycolicibacterium mucogenicum]MCX8559793.1 hypothetical protein [Mycolicibacterium mucogenicum]